MTNFTNAGMVSPYAITSGPHGAHLPGSPTRARPGRSSIGEITTSGSVSTFTDPRITNPYGIITDGSTLWITNLPARRGWE